MSHCTFRSRSVDKQCDEPSLRPANMRESMYVREYVLKLGTDTGLGILMTVTGGWLLGRGISSDTVRGGWWLGRGCGGVSACDEEAAVALLRCSLQHRFNGLLRFSGVLEAGAA